MTLPPSFRRRSSQPLCSQRGWVGFFPICLPPTGAARPLLVGPGSCCLLDSPKAPGHMVSQTFFFWNSWSAKLSGPSDCPWSVNSARTYARRVGVGPTQYFKVLATHQLQACMVAPPAFLWQPACVVDTPHPSDPEAVIKYLVGSWDSVQIDPSVWCLGSATLLTYEVKLATSRIIQWHCRKAPGWVPGAGLRPKLWGEGGGSGPALVSAATNIASRQKRRFEEALAAAGGSGVGRPPVPAADLAPLYHASWFDPSPPRQHVRQRVENRAAAVTQQRLVQQAAHAAILSHSLMIHAILLGLLLVMRMWHLPLGAKLGGEPPIHGSPGPRECLLGACSMLPSHVVELQLCFFRLGIQLSLTRDAATLAAPHCH